MMTGTIKAGCCTDCGELIWRMVEHPRQGRVLLWPMPESLYARVWTETGPAVGIGYCRACAPALGMDAQAGVLARIGEAKVSVLTPKAVVMDYETATRYQAWFADGYGVWLRDWLKQECLLGKTAVEEHLRQWQADREAVTAAAVTHG